MSQATGALRARAVAAAAAACAVALAVPSAQQTSIKKSYPLVRDMRGVVPPGPRVAPYNSPPLGDGPWQFETYEQRQIKVSVVTKGLSHPWSIAFILVSVLMWRRSRLAPPLFLVAMGFPVVLMRFVFPGGQPFVPALIVCSVVGLLGYWYLRRTGQRLA